MITSLVLPFRLSRAVLVIFALAAGAVCCPVHGEVLHDFEESTEGWGCTQPNCDGPRISAEQATRGKSSLAFDAVFPGHAEVSVRLNHANWADYEEISVNIFLPANAPKNTQAMLFVKDRDHHWYQYLAPDFLRPGVWNHVKASLSGASKAWEFRGHYRPWSGTTARDLLEFGVRVFSKDKPFRGVIYLDEVTLRPASNDKANNATATQAKDGFIRNLRVNKASVGQYEKFEITFELPKDYANPFSPEEVAVDALFISPSGKHISVPGFFYQDYMREGDHREEKFTAVGRGLWKVRFAPMELGRYYYRVIVKDRETRAQTSELSFVCEPSANPGFVRVSQTVGDEPCRYFEFSNGTFFFPIGHNIRSPYDERYVQAPWATLRPHYDLGSRAYDHYFAQMQANGENFTEVWMASWWVALEWKNNAPGYHGIGHYNTLHAWKLDHLLEKAREHGIYVLLVINNHGKFSTFVNPEWASNPFNKINGGPFDSPDEFFTDPRGRVAMRNRLRYIVARWGYSTQVFGWKLFSEINLTGSNREFHRTPEMREWHREMASYLKEIDPWKHPVTTHYSGDYRVQDPRLVSLPELDFCTVDAYHGMQNALRIVELINETCHYNRQFNKPVIITEFGGSAMGTKATILRKELHNALWASVCSPSAATPLLWWWMFIDENNLYELFKPVALFMRGEDRRGQGLELASDSVELRGPSAERIGVQPLQGKHNTYVWLYDRGYFSGAAPPESAVVYEGLRLHVSQLVEGDYNVEVWDTYTGEVIESKRLSTKKDTLEVGIPSFRKDVALKIKRVQN